MTHKGGVGEGDDGEIHAVSKQKARLLGGRKEMERVKGGGERMNENNV